MNNQLPEVRLRAIEPEDLDALYAIENDRTVWNLGVTNVPYSRYVLHDYIANAKNDIYADGQVRLLVEGEGGAVTGIVDLVDFDPRNNKAEVGIVIRSEYRHQGYGTAAMVQLLAYASSVLHLHQVYAVISEGNGVAVSLFERLGFRQASVLADWLYDGKEYSDAVLLQTFL